MSLRAWLPQRTFAFGPRASVWLTGINRGRPRGPRVEAFPVEH
jgi:hypothetical protein